VGILFCAAWASLCSLGFQAKLKSWFNNGVKQFRRPIMTASDNLSDRDMHRAELASSDEDVESLLSGGADISELIEAGVLDDDEPPLLSKEEKARFEAEAEAYISQPSDLSPEEIWAKHLRHQEWLEANGHKQPPAFKYTPPKNG
jgi:hypothetical protein